MKALILAISLVTAAGTAVDDDFKNFTAYLDEAEMSFVKPEGFIPTKIKTNPDVLYQYALKHAGKKLEIRYSIWPLKKDIEVYKKSLTDKNVVLTDPNKGHLFFSMAVVLNISGGEQSHARGMTEFDTGAVKAEFNADWGASFITEAKSEFGKGYVYALIVALHRDDRGNAFIIYLFDDIKEVQDLIQNNFHTVKFR